MKRYDSYKDSGVEWLGEIPSHWRKSKFKFVSDLYTGNSLNDSQKLQYESENFDDIPYVSSKDIDVEFQTVNYNNGLRIPRDNNQLKISPKGSFLMVIEGGSSGRKKVYLEQDVCFVNKLCSFNSRENNKFQYYFIQSSNYQDKFKLSMSGLIGGVSISNLKDFELTLPPLSEQQQIVSFLDTKTSLIDSLIEKSQRKIELLKEKRISLINEVVTKGLESNVEMKDSGVEWIGKVPSDWGFVKLKQLFFINKRISGELGYDVLSVTQRGLKVKDLENNEGQHSMDYSKYQLVFEGDFVMNHMDLLTGYVDLSKQLGVTSPDYRVFTKSSERVNSPYYLYLFQLCYIQKIFYGLGQGVSNLGRWRLPSVEFLNMYLPFPSLKEQQQIVEYLDEQTQLIDNTISIEEKRIELLKEYRQSLISEVVTGKRKVTDDIFTTQDRVTLPERVPNEIHSLSYNDHYLVPDKDLLGFLNSKLTDYVETEQQHKSIVNFFIERYWELSREKLSEYNVEYQFWRISKLNSGSIKSHYYEIQGVSDEMRTDNSVHLIKTDGVIEKCSSVYCGGDSNDSFYIYNQ